MYADVVLPFVFPIQLGWRLILFSVFYKTVFLTKVASPVFHGFWVCAASWPTLQMKWESNINVCFRFMYSQNETAGPRNFQNRIIIFCPLISTFMYLWAIYIFTGLVCLFCCSQKGRPIPHRYMNVGIGNKAVQLHFWEFINQIFSTVKLVKPPFRVVQLAQDRKASDISLQAVLTRKN